MAYRYILARRDWQTDGTSFIYLSKDWFGHDPCNRHDTFEVIVFSRISLYIHNASGKKCWFKFSFMYTNR